MPTPGRGTKVPGEATSLEWPDVERRLSKGGWFWLATVRPDGAPHVMPVFAVWSESGLFVASKRSARKSRDLDADGRRVVSAEVDGAHLVVEGEADRVRDPEMLGRASAAFLDTYGWPTTVAGDELDAEFGAPTSGGPPYRIYRIAPTTIFALPYDGSFQPTRVRFA
ncbi:MAG TPA: pyridoxamine 5'-phosphate oxidase family protein [Actinopolymorphaceae bacterium]